MADDVTPAPQDEPKADAQAEPKVEDKKEQKPVLDPNRPMSQQVDKLVAQLPKEEEEEKKDEQAEPKEEPKETEEEQVTQEEAEPNEEPEEDEVETPAVEAPEGTWQQYVLENLQPFTVHILDANGKPKTLQIKTPQQLPEGYSWPSAAAQDEFHIALAAQEKNATTLQADFTQKQQVAQWEQFQAQEAVDIQDDIEALQKEGLLDKFKYSENDPKFNEDPAVKTANEIYDIYKKTNEGYMRKYANSNRTFRISYRDAADKYFAQKARQPKGEPAPTASKERTQVAAKVSAPQSAAPEAGNKPLPPGATMQDVLKLYKLGRI